ncbi:MAG: DUF4214 domain-containing protein [Rhodospirillales bacterium]|nr:DUF4214 domain-containing protein [Rhodospirillales bacterium]
MATSAELITQLYVGYYNRAPDPEGLNYWVGRYAAGMSLVEIAESFAVQTESTDNYVYLKYPNIADSSSFITAIYNNLFGRAPDAEGLAYWKNELDTGSVSAAKMIVAVINGAQGDDATMVANKVDVGIYYAEQFLSKTWTAADNLAGATSVLSGVTADTATVTTGKAAADTEVAAEDDANTVGLTLNLTTAADNLEGGEKNDTISGGVGTLGSADDIDGKAGTDTLNVRLGSAAQVAPVISNVEEINVTFRGASASLNFADITGYSAINVDGNTSGDLVNLANGSTVTMTNGYQSILSATLASAADTANSLTVQANGVGTAAFRATAIETLNIANTGTAAWTIGAGLDINGTKTINVSGNGNVTMNLAAAADGGDATAINAAGLSGNLSVTLNDWAGTGNVAVVGGAGDDTFAFSATMTTGDSVDGGAGTDTVTMSIETALRTANSAAAGISLTNVETLSVTFATAQTAYGSGIDSNLSTLNLRYTTAAAFTKMGNSIQTIAVQSATTAGAFDFTYASGQTGTDVVLNLGLTTAAETATTAAHGLSAGAITIAGNTGGLTINSVGQSANLIGETKVNSVNSLTINAASQNLSITGGTALAANAAKSVTIDAAGKDFSAVGDFSFTAATSVAVSVSGGTAANVVMGDINASKADTISLTTDGSNTAGIAIGSATVGSALDTVNIGASGGNVTVGQLNTITIQQTAGMAVDVNITAATGATVNLTDVVLTTAITAQMDMSFVLAGGGTVNIAASAGAYTATTAGSHTVFIDGSGFSGTLSANFATLNSGAKMTATLGAGTGIVILGAGNDSLNAGGTGQTLVGGLGDNTYTMASGAQTIILGANAGSAGAVSAMTFETATLNGVGTGDVIIFAMAHDGTSVFFGSAAHSGVALNTGVVNSAAADPATFGTVKYSISGGDTIVTVNVSTGGDTSLYTVTLKDFVATATASFTVATSAFGLAVTIA